MNISEFDYDLPDERIVRFPADERDASKLLVWKDGDISETTFGNIGNVLPEGSLLVFNNTRVVRARLVMHKPAATGVATGGARIEILCLEPRDPADYERAFAARGHCEWSCMVGNLKKWKSGPLAISFKYNDTGKKLLAWKVDAPATYLPPQYPRQPTADNLAPVGEPTLPDGRVRFEWDADLTFGQILEFLGRMPIPPYLDRDSAEVDNTRYQTVYALIEGSVAAPTAGLHFTPELIARLQAEGIDTGAVTLHVGAGTFLPVKTENALDHTMHTEYFEVTLAAVEHLIVKSGKVIAIGTTSVRTLESLAALAYRIVQTGGPAIGDSDSERPVGQFETYDIPAEFDGLAALKTLAAYMRTRGIEKIAASTRIMITPAGFSFRIVNGIITNFHQPKSTLLLLIAAFTCGGEWRKIYDHALSHDFRFLSYGDSSLLLRGV